MTNNPKKLTIVKISFTKVFVPVVFFILLSVTGYYLLFHNSSSGQHIVYMDNTKVFSEFNLTKDIIKEHQKDIDRQKFKVDSLAAVLHSRSSNDSDGVAEGLFVAENNKLRQLSEYYSSEVSHQVWERINDYMREYGELSQYSLILGATGNGNIMYGDKLLDITEDFLEFANNKYEGK